MLGDSTVVERLELDNYGKDDQWLIDQTVDILKRHIEKEKNVSKRLSTGM
jgi:hypothetical protein